MADDLGGKAMAIVQVGRALHPVFVLFEDDDTIWLRLKSDRWLFVAGEHLETEPDYEEREAAYQDALRPKVE
jgi:hypothetical protein